MYDRNVQSPTYKRHQLSPSWHAYQTTIGSLQSILVLNQAEPQGRGKRPSIIIITLGSVAERVGQKSEL